MFCLFAMATLTAGSVTFALTNPRMNITSVELKGAKLTDAKAIEKITGAAVGSNIVLFRKASMLRKIADHNEVQFVKMGRKYPNKLWVRVWEREPCAAIINDGHWYLIQSDGFVFHKTSAVPKGAPMVHLATATPLKPGQRCQSPAVSSVLQIIRIAAQHQTEFRKIIVDQFGDICLNMDSDLCVKLGQPDEIARKMSLLRHALLERPSIAREGEYIDLSCPSAPVWKRKATLLTAS